MVSRGLKRSQTIHIQFVQDVNTQSFVAFPSDQLHPLHSRHLVQLPRIILVHEGAPILQSYCHACGNCSGTFHNCIFGFVQPH